MATISKNTLKGYAKDEIKWYRNGQCFNHFVLTYTLLSNCLKLFFRSWRFIHVFMFHQAQLFFFSFADSRLYQKLCPSFSMSIRDARVEKFRRFIARNFAVPVRPFHQRRIRDKFLGLPLLFCVTTCLISQQKLISQLLFFFPLSFLAKTQTSKTAQHIA